MVKTTLIDRIMHRIFPGKSLEKQVEEELDNHIRLAELERSQIRRRQFDLHVTLSHIDALKAWTEGKIRTPRDPI